MKEGSELAEALAATRRFDPDVVAIVSVGEETGDLPESLQRLANDYQEQVEHMVKNLGTLIQPFVYIVLGGMVLFVILAIFLPLLTLISDLSR